MFGSQGIVYWQVEPWINSSNLDDLLRYHMIGCKQLLQSDLQSANEVVTLSGYRLRISVQEVLFLSPPNQYEHRHGSVRKLDFYIENVMDFLI